jgi:cytochrome c-type biogenesis protein
MYGPTWGSFGIGLGVLALIALGGYVVFLNFAAGGPALSGGGYLLVAVVAGTAAFFSPCSFPLLPSYFAAYSRAVGGQGRSAGRSAILAHGSAPAAGVITFNVILGLVLVLAGLGIAKSFALIGPSPSQVTQAIRSVVAVALVGLGIAQVGGLSLHGRSLEWFTRSFQSRSVQRGPLTALFLYGFGYTVIGIGCTGPFLASVMVIALAAGGLLPALGSFLAFALTMAALMLIVSLIASGSKRKLLRGLGAASPKIKNAAGAVLIGFGAFLLLTTIWPGILAPLFP